MRSTDILGQLPCGKCRELFWPQIYGMPFLHKDPPVEFYFCSKCIEREGLTFIHNKDKEI